ncbi:helix-turn-helix transcriptional regulator [Pseudomonas sp. p1(2021b)]|uniref:AraC family transcriptional regulator n=1 Tax=Pseudomonas sp. p1(2021b) TaxID=2874628 RepID=UPI001CCA9014|nr:helix-turn-helix transcriptional regulator [Pseudomonas sp. p1(2021b)]UBM23630.1 helix-turn-helix transcriptional regulator [Pseudomonas sp. p1(2021b)]
MIAAQHLLPPDQEIATLALDLADGTHIDTHRHAHGQLLYTTQGTLMVNTNQGCWVVPCNHGLWIPAEVAHWTRTLGATRIRTLYFAPWRTPDMPGECTVYGISNLVRELIIEASAIDEEIAQGSRNARLIEFLLEELAGARVSAIYLPRPRGQRLHALCRDLVQNRMLDWGLAECAEFLGINIKTVQRWFHEDVGMSFGTWRKQARLLIALDRLAQGHNILEVSLDAGYSTPSAFTAMFKREFGLPPRAFQPPRR